MKETQKLKIFVCESDIRILNRLRSWIIAIGEEVTSFFDGIEAFEMIKKNPPDMILMSQNIKNIGSIELIENIKKVVPDQAIIFIINDDSLLFKDAINLQVDRYLNSPVEAKPLFYAIESLAEEKLWHEKFRVQKRVLQDYKDAIDLSFSISRHDKNGEIIYVNDLFCITMKLRHVDAMKGIINPLQNEYEDMRVVWDALKTDFIYRDRQVFKLKDKTERIVDITAVALMDKNETVYEYLVFSNDVTEIIHSKRKIKNQELDNRLAKLDHEKELNKVKDNFLTIFTHELKTPLNSIINFSQYVQKHLQKENFQKRDRLVEQVHEINESGLFMLEMINNLMEAMRLKDSKIKLKLKQINLNTILDDAIAGKLKSKNVTLVCDENLKIISDKTYLVKILKNIFSNAIKYAKSEVIITLQAKDNDKFVIVMEDDGNGFSSMDNIFELFEQSDTDSMTREARGTGVGLYIVKQLCDRMHYDIGVGISKKLGGAEVIIKGDRMIKQ